MGRTYLVQKMSPHNIHITIFHQYRSRNQPLPAIFSVAQRGWYLPPIHKGIVYKGWTFNQNIPAKIKSYSKTATCPPFQQSGGQIRLSVFVRHKRQTALLRKGQNINPAITKMKPYFSCSANSTPGSATPHTATKKQPDNSG